VRISSIHPWHLLKASFQTIPLFYGALLIFSVPLSISPLFDFIVPESLHLVFGTLYYLSIWSIFSAAAILYIYCKINGREITIGQSIQLSLSKFSTLLVWRTLQMFLFIDFIPRLVLITWGIMVEDQSIEDAVRRIWNLTRGYGWQIFGSLIALRLGFRAIQGLSNGVISATFGVSIVDMSQQSSIIYLPGVVAKVFNVGLNVFLFTPFNLTFYLLIFLYLLDVERRRVRSTSTATLAAQPVE
jgi:hypothetical protein